MAFPNRSGEPLRISRTDRMIGGVCGGMARWLGIDPWLVRLLYVLISIVSAGFPGTLVYIALWIGLPDE